MRLWLKGFGFWYHAGIRFVQIGWIYGVANDTDAISMQSFDSGL